MKPKLFYDPYLESLHRTCSKDPIVRVLVSSVSHHIAFTTT